MEGRRGKAVMQTALSPDSSEFSGSWRTGAEVTSASLSLAGNEKATATIIPVEEVQMHTPLCRWQRRGRTPTFCPSLPPFKMLMSEKPSKLQVFQNSAFQVR